MYHELTEGQPRKEAAERSEFHRGNYLVAIAVNIVFLYIVNNLISNIQHPLDQYASKDYPGLINNIINWVANFQAPFLNHSFISCLWAINLALFLGIMGNFVLLLYRPRWFLHLVQAVISASGFLAVLIVFRTFPFEISAEALKTVVRALLIVLMAGLSIGLIVELIRFIKSPLPVPRAKPPDNNNCNPI